MTRIVPSRNLKESLSSRKIKFKEKEDNFATKKFFCGPGVVKTYYIDEEEGDYDEKETEYDRLTAKKIERFILNDDDWYTDLAPYYKNKGVKSILFSHITSFDGYYYTVWDVTYDPEKVDIDDLKDYLEGQMSDGWGESLEQNAFFEERQGYGQREEKYYSPWNFDNFEILIEGIDFKARG